MRLKITDEDIKPIAGYLKEFDHPVVKETSSYIEKCSISKGEVHIRLKVKQIPVKLSARIAAKDGGFLLDITAIEVIGLSIKPLARKIVRHEIIKNLNKFPDYFKAEDTGSNVLIFFKPIKIKNIASSGQVLIVEADL